MELNLIEIIRKRSKLSDKGVTFVVSTDTKDFVSYAQLYELALEKLHVLQSSGVKPGDELILQSSDNKDFLIVFWACILGGIIPVPVTQGATEDHKQKVFRIAQILNTPWLYISRKDWSKLEVYGTSKFPESTRLLASHLIIPEELNLQKGRYGTEVEVQPDDIAFIQFSSGSTGDPKGVTLTHRNLIANVEAISLAGEYRSADKMVSWMPLTHDMGMIGFHLNPVYSAMDHYIIPTNLFVRRPGVWLNVASDHQATILCSPNFGYRYLLKHFKPAEVSWDLSSVRLIYNGAEPISEQLCEEFLLKMASYNLRPVAMCPVYGLAEASLAVSISNLDDNVKSVKLDRDHLNFRDEIREVTDGDGISFVNVGRAIKHTNIRIADNDGEELSDNVIGNIEIHGINVTAGYYNNKEASEKVIHADGWLNTGDLGFKRNGVLFVTGRAKDILFVNGQNYYPHDIEKTAEQVDGIELNKIIVTGYFDTRKQSDEIIAFVFHRGKMANFVPVAAALKRHISEEFGVSIDKVLPVKDIPRTTSGKLQRFKILTRYLAGEFVAVEKDFSAAQYAAGSEVVIPVTDNEKKLYDFWKELFPGQVFGIEDKFIELGGNSLKAAELSMFLRKEFGVDLPPEKYYDFQTIKELSEGLNSLDAKAYSPIPKAEDKLHFPALEGQKRLYYAWEIQPDSVAYNMPELFMLSSGIDCKRLEDCIAEVVMGNENFHQVFEMREEPCVKRKRPERNTIQIAKINMDNAESSLSTLIKPFDLQKGPLFRFAIISTTDNTKYLFTDFHHIISDGQSVSLFIDELTGLYHGESRTSSASLIDYAEWKTGEHTEDTPHKEKDFWMQYLGSDLPVLDLPADHQRPAVPDRKGAKHYFSFDDETTLRLNHIAKINGTTLSSVCLALYGVLLSKYTRQSTFVVGVPLAGRTHPDIRKTQGMFVNNLPVKIEIADKYSFKDALKTISTDFTKILDNQHSTVSDLVYWTGVPTDPSRNPLFDTMLLFQNISSSSIPDEENTERLIQKRIPIDPGFSKYDLSLEVFETGAQLQCAFEYATSLFEESTILNMADAFAILVKKVLDDPAVKVKDILPLSAMQKAEILDSYNDTDQPYDLEGSVIEHIEKQALRFPEKVVLRYGDGSYTYSALMREATSVASGLQDCIRGGDTIVALMMERTPDFIISVLAVLKAGLTYLPIDPQTPADRVAKILCDSKCCLMISDLNLKPDYKGTNITTVSALAENGTDYKRVDNLSQNPAYVIYTSGTTGMPKGVVIGHSSLINYCRWAASMYVKDASESFALHSAISFDLTVTSVFVPLLSGSEIVMYKENAEELPIERVIRANEATVIKLTPSHLRLLIDNGLLTDKLSVKRLIVGGEQLDRTLAEKVYQVFGGNIEILNEYGPTEATVGCMIHLYQPGDRSHGVPIGKPAANTQIYVLDKSLNPVPFNVTGDLYIAGSGLAGGYLHNEEQTAKKFIDNPFTPGTKMYVTGDLARRLPDGNLEFIGRSDEQVKISGYRIEPEEIEHRIAEFEGINSVKVITNGPEARKFLSAYYTLSDQVSNIDETALITALSEKLPHYMVPSVFTKLDELPLTYNGKLDVRALPQTKDSADTKNLSASDVEMVILETWREVLDNDAVTVEDNFFRLGGDSIKAVQIVAKLRNNNLKLSVKDILTYHTIRQVSGRVSSEMADRYEQGVVHGHFMPTPIHRWFLQTDPVNIDFYNQSVLLRLNVDYSPNNLRNAIAVVLNHHDAFHLRYEESSDRFIYHEKREFSAEHISSHSTEGQSLNHTAQQIKKSLDLRSGKTVAVAFINDENEHYLFMTAHHAVVDGLSWRIILQDIYDCYQAAQSGGEYALPDKTASFKDWSDLLMSTETFQSHEEEAGYWKEIDQTKFCLPADRTPDEWKVADLNKVTTSLSQEETEFLLTDANKTFNTDAQILLNAALVRALDVCFNTKESVIELENHGRHLSGTDTTSTVGWFTAMFPVKFTSDDQTDRLIKNTKETLKNVPGNGLGYGLFKYGADRISTGADMAEVRLNYLGQFGNELNNSLFAYDYRETGPDCDPENRITAKFEINAMVLNNMLELEMQYSDKAYEKETVARFIREIITQLTDILAYLRNESEVQFTPSDFTAVDLSEEELNELF